MKRSKFNLSYTKLLSCDLGELVPVGLTEVLPGDSFRMSTSALVRCSALLAPVMHAVHVGIHHWYVPNRIVWNNWENFITGGPDGLNADTVPTLTLGGGSGAAVGSLADYLGIPTGVNNLVVNALPFRGYAKIWNEYYRDQDLQTPLVVSTANGPDTTTSVALQNCAWEKDYFTSSRPWEQKGPSVSIPLTGNAPVVRVSGGVGGTLFIGGGNTAVPSGGTLETKGSGKFGRAGQSEQLSYDPIGSLNADLSGVSAVTINALRQASAIQRYQEARARYGSRYTEYLAYLGVTSSDARLQRPEYLGGGRQTLQFSEIVQTAEGTNPVGELRGHGITALKSNNFQCFFEEHGFVFSLMFVRPKTIYERGLFRHWNRRTKLDYWQRELQHIGQQPVLNKEVYAAHGTPDGTFGYQDRYDEYRRSESLVAGEFRTSLQDYWHFARIFGSAPALNSTFVSCVPAERSFAVPAEDVLQIHARHHIGARRLVASVGTSFLA